MSANCDYENADIWGEFAWAEGASNKDDMPLREKLIHKEQVKVFVVVNRVTKSVMYGEDHLWVICPVLNPKGSECAFAELNVACLIELIGVCELSLFDAIMIIHNARVECHKLITKWLVEFVMVEGECDTEEAMDELVRVEVNFGPQTQKVWDHVFATDAGKKWVRSQNNTEIMIRFPCFIKCAKWIIKSRGKRLIQQSLMWPTLYVQRLMSLKIWSGKIDYVTSDRMKYGVQMLHQLSLLFFYFCADQYYPALVVPRNKHIVNERQQKAIAKSSFLPFEIDK